MKNRLDEFGIQFEYFHLTWWWSASTEISDLHVIFIHSFLLNNHENILGFFFILVSNASLSPCVGERCLHLGFWWPFMKGASMIMNNLLLQLKKSSIIVQLYYPSTIHYNFHQIIIHHPYHFIFTTLPFVERSLFIPFISGIFFE